MKRILSSTAGLAVAALACGGLLTGFAASAHAATNPPWEPDANSAGSLTFYNASGTAITGGSTATAPFAAYVEGSAAPRAGDTKATLYGYLPTAKNPGYWSGEELTASTGYPNAAAPAPLKTAALPVTTGSASDESLATLAADLPNGTSATGYKNVYQLRLYTSGPGETKSLTYDSADIQITGSTWSEIYPTSGTPTTTTVTATSKSIKFGGSVTLHATVTPSTATGSVEFFDGKKALKTVALTSAAATLTTTKLAGGSQKISAVYEPDAASSGLAASMSAPVTVSRSRRWRPRSR